MLHDCPRPASALLLAALPAALGGCDCTKEFRGIHDGDTIETTVVSNDTFASLGAGAGCGALPDLPPGAVLTSKASVVTSRDGAQACFNVLRLTPAALTTGTFQVAPDGTTVLRLPNGCSGEFSVYFQSSDGSTSFLDDTMPNGRPAWWLVRTFEAMDFAACFPDGAEQSVCTDAFVATNARR